MSSADINIGELMLKMEEERSENKPKYRSYKKKFLKLRHKFKDHMRESARLYEEEQHAIRLARRLQEQNDQLLDLLLDVNDSDRIPHNLRYDLRSPTPNASDVPSLEPDRASDEAEAVEGARAALLEARNEYAAGEISFAEYKEQEAQLTAVINGPQPLTGPKALTTLSRTAHTTLDSVDRTQVIPHSVDIFEDAPTGYLDPSHEEEMLNAIDATLTNGPIDQQPSSYKSPRVTEKEKEKDFQLHNPVSVYNWLQRHSEKASLPKETEKEPRHEENNVEVPVQKPRPSPKPSPAGIGSSKPNRKRTSSSLIPRQELEELILDDEGFVIAGAEEPAFNFNRKRKRDDDAYRPKGGSSKAKKRPKRESISTSTRRVEPDLEEEDAAE